MLALDAAADNSRRGQVTRGQLQVDRENRAQQTQNACPNLILDDVRMTYAHFVTFSNNYSDDKAPVYPLFFNTPA